MKLVHHAYEIMSGLLISTAESSAVPCLDRQDVHVWFCDLARYDDERAPLAALLSHDEQSRVARFAFERDRHRFTLSHGLLRVILARYVGGEAARIEFERGAHGKPAVSGPPNAKQEIHFSLSHSGDYALVAVATGRAVGVDVEVRRPDVHAFKLAQRFFASGESRQIAQAQGDERQRLFYRYWTAKEAYLKGRGVGLSLGLDQFEILFEGQSPAARVRLTDSGTFDHAWLVQTLPLRDHLAGALAVTGQSWQVRMFDATAFPLL